MRTNYSRGGNEPGTTVRYVEVSRAVVSILMWTLSLIQSCVTLFSSTILTEAQYMMAVKMAAAILIIVLNVFVLIVTVMKTAHQARQASLLGLETTLSEILLRDGKCPL